ncbi:MAG: HD domain-containing protein [Lachnospiraceae bacterium]|nr:HD domain-containing protein [Lachnospiraceae bacterium]
MVMDMPADVRQIIGQLEGRGHEAYAVGGCVRDTILSRIPGDWDITTSARPEQVKEIFHRTIDTGIQHGTVTVLLHHVGYEVTTYRIDGEYADNRHPDQVEFTNSLNLDLERRDFTINAMAYNDTKGLVDPYDGMGDLKHCVIRCVGNPDERFDEDALRMLRAVRFSGQLGFRIEEQTRQAIIRRAKFLRHVSAERIRVEIMKLLTSKDAGQIREAYATRMTAVFLPELDRMLETDQCNPHHIYTVGEHSIRGVEWMNRFFGDKAGNWDDSFIPPEVEMTVQRLTAECTGKQRQILCLAMLLHDVAKPECMTVDEEGIGHFYGHPGKGSHLASQIMQRLTFDRETMDTVSRLIACHDRQIPPVSKSVRKAASQIGRDLMPLLTLMQCADVLSQNPDTIEPKLARILAVEELYQSILQTEAPLSVKELAISGKDLIAIGMEPGPQMGVLLGNLLEMVLENPERNTREELLELAKQSMGIG